MAKDKQKEIKPETKVKAVEDIPKGMAVGTGVYKPIPRFRGNCKNC